MPDTRFSLANTSRQRTPAIPYEAMKDAVLGKRYELSLALVSPAEARLVTRKTKGKNKASNVLAFPLSRASGEIVLCPATAREQAPRWDKTPREMIAFLFIHGLLHLKGCSHGVTMEREERRFMKRFGFA